MLKVFKIVIILYIVVNILPLFNIRSSNIESIFKGYNSSNINISVKEDINNYYMILEIPNISLKRYIYDIDDTKNNIDLNVELLYKDDMVILVSHSGNGDNAFFRNLKYLKMNDIVNLYIDNKKDIYVVGNIYSIKKTSEFGINNGLKNKLILITCLDRNNYLIIECQRQIN